MPEENNDNQNPLLTTTTPEAGPEGDQTKSSVVATSVVMDDEYKAKIRRLRNRIIFNLSTSIFFIIFIVATFFYGQSASNNNTSDVTSLNTKIGDLKNKSSNIESRVNEVKKYKQIWLKIDDSKKNFSGIKISDINDNFNNLATKYGLISASINISAPETLKDGIYNRPTLEVQLINCTMDFQSLTDRVAINFVNEFLKTVPGYVIVSNVSIKKSKKEGYSEADLIDISNGKIVAATATKVTFSWYFLKNKTPIVTPVASDPKK